MVGEHAVAPVERSLRHSVEKAECGHDGARRQHLNLEVSTGHFVNLLGEVEGVFVKYVLGRPCALPAKIDWALRLGNGRQSHGRRGCGSGAAEELAASRGFDCFFLGHVSPPWMDRAALAPVLLRRTND